MKSFNAQLKTRNYREKLTHSDNRNQVLIHNRPNFINPPIKRYPQTCCVRTYNFNYNNVNNKKGNRKFNKFGTNRRWKQRFDKIFKDRVIVNPKDPLNLLELEKEQEQRMTMGLSPLPGDSAFNTPVIYSGSYNMNNTNSNCNLKNLSDTLNETDQQLTSSRKDNRFTLYFNGYHYKTKPEDRLKYFLPDWFSYSCICDYGCHRGDFSFKLFELFHSRISKLDCIDVRKNCILNAKHIQREKMRCELMRRIQMSDNNNNSSNGVIIDYSKINFKYGNWVKDKEWTADLEGANSYEDCEYDIIIALGVTKLIHLYYGDTGLEKFLRRACYRLKPGGHLIVELQSRSKYVEAVRDIGKPFIAKNFKNIKIQPDKLEPLLASVGFPYCCKINTTQWNKKNDQGDILLCTKPIGTTPVPIRDTNTSELMLKYSSFIPKDDSRINPPPVNYTPRSTDVVMINNEADNFDNDLTDYNFNELPNNEVNNDNNDDENQFPDSTVIDED